MYNPGQWRDFVYLFSWKTARWIWLSHSRAAISGALPEIPLQFNCSIFKEIPLQFNCSIFKDFKRFESKEFLQRGGGLELELEFTCGVLETRCESGTLPHTCLVLFDDLVTWGPVK